ncbi:nucleotidyltransferase domain-containing protein [Pseudonocardia nigra]|uniref:nucleotidyltransferase domain-containing protein n=1 Tax=Pseudonocardia nigra TaxID=1921578 RepID=UPI001C5DCE8F|nr:nucleotidyltransferase domain-containing protein [Pseudonocardia nigra]
MRHHEDTLAEFVAAVRADPESLAVVAVGSVARGTERPDSDVDVYLVVTDDQFARAGEQNRLSYVRRDVATYPDGYVDVKLATLSYLEAAVERGDDPVRASFVRARVVWSCVADLADLVARIPLLPDGVWEARAASFIAQVRLYGGYFLPQAGKLGNVFLRHHAAVHLVNAAGRALLAHHRVLFRGPKYLEETLRALDPLPEDHLGHAARLLADPTPEAGAALMASLEAFHPWPLAREETLSVFVRDNELAWLTGTPPPEFS